MDYESAFRKPFSDVKNLIIGIALNIFPIVNLFALGYQLECSGLGRNKAGKKMPEWKDFGDYFMKGLIVALIAVVYLIPAVLLLAIGALSTILSLIAGNFSSFLNPLQAGNGMMMMQSAFSTLIAVSPMFMLTGILFLIAGYLIPAAALTFLKEKKFSAALQFGKVAKRAFNGTYFIAFLVMIGTAVVLGLILGWIPFIGSAAVSFITGVIFYSLLGQDFK